MELDDGGYLVDSNNVVFAYGKLMRSEYQGMTIYGAYLPEAFENSGC